MSITLHHSKWPGLRRIIEGIGASVAAVSGGVDSLLLATLAHDLLPGRLVVAHAVSPAVPQADTLRVKEQAQAQGWRLVVLSSGEFEDERYLGNPYDRCYFCKSHLYAALHALTEDLAQEFGGPVTMLSGANTDDLGEHRPGLLAASENGVRHPFVEAQVAKREIREMARELGLPFADLPASPCLSSRVYTGTRVTPERLEAVAFAEGFLKLRLGVAVVRCRIREDGMLVEFERGQTPQTAPEAVDDLAKLLSQRFPSVARVAVDPEGYSPGRAFRPIL
jgi:pyridinium-3,5-biscarboxylic acid mononucleotide sulfurtransferase